MNTVIRVVCCAGLAIAAFLISGCTTFENSIELRAPVVKVPVSASSSVIKNGDMVKASGYKVIEHFTFDSKLLWSLGGKPKIAKIDITKELTEQIEKTGADAIVNLRIVMASVDNAGEIWVGMERIIGSVVLVFGGVAGIVAIATESDMGGPIAIGMTGIGAGFMGLSFITEWTGVTTYVFSIEGDAVKFR